jgi:hypothetical protein
MVCVLLGAALLSSSGCDRSSDDRPKPDRSAESFCSTWQDAVSSLDTGGGSAERAEELSLALWQALAERSPEAELTEALHVIVELHDPWREQTRRLESGSIQDVDDFDAELNDAYLRAFRVFIDREAELCG